MKFYLLSAALIAAMGSAPLGAQSYIANDVIAGMLSQGSGQHENCYNGKWDSTPAETEAKRPGAEPAMRLYLQFAAAPGGDVSGAFFHAHDMIYWSLDGVKTPVSGARDPWAAKVARIEPVGFALGNWKRRYRAQWRAIAADGSVIGLYDAYMRKKGDGQQLLGLDLYSPTATVQPKPMGRFCEFPGDTDKWAANMAEEAAKKAAKRAAREAERAKAAN